MRLNEEIGPEEYARKKDDLTQEKQKYEGLIADTQDRIETWLKRAEEMFTYAQTAQNRFETGTLEDKRYVLSCLGSNLVLSGKQLRLQVDKTLALIQEVAPDVQSLHNRLASAKPWLRYGEAGLEPTQLVDSTTSWEALYAQNKKWGRWLKQVRNCLVAA